MGKKILIVDDEPDVLKLAQFRLKKMGYDVVTAINGKQALEVIPRVNPDLILLDLRLPVIDGYEVCRIIKADEKLKQIPVILFTASDPNKVPQEIKNLKAEDCIIKPYEPEDLIAKVKKFIK